MLEFLFNLIFSALATCSFAIMYNAPRGELLHCTLTGTLAWLVYYLVRDYTTDPVLGAFFGAVAVAICSRILSYTRRAPSTLFLLPGIIPLVPGARMYKTMTSVISNNMYYSFLDAVTVFKIAGVIAVGIILIFSMPYSVFAIIAPKDKK